MKQFSLAELQQLIQTFGHKPFLADYIFAFIHQKHVTALDQISPLPKTFRAELQQAGFGISQIRLLEQHQDPDSTVKFVFELPEGGRIETVLLNDQGRNTLCLSTQAGCRMGCLFCATGQLKYQRNLTAAEIVDQVYLAGQKSGKIHNLVYMGMGEPLDNFDQVIRSIELLNHPKGANIGIRHITVSTCGLPEGIRKLAENDLTPRLAVSLHASNDPTRQRLMQIGKTVTIEAIIKALKEYQGHTNRRVTIEYCMIAGVNDSDAQARSLIRLLQGLKVNINLIELNPFPGCPFEASEPARIRSFSGILTDAGIETIVRYRRGRSIKAACGQLGATRLGESK